MIEAQTFIESVRARGVTFFTGVPCSFLTPLIDGAISSSVRYVGATSEGEATGLAAGAWLSGASSVVMCQNSGLGNVVNPLTSLVWPCRIPFLMVCTWRGEPGLSDEPQHELMGRVTHRLLELIQIGSGAFPTTVEEVAPRLDRAEAWMDEHCLPFCLVMRKDSVAKSDLREPVPVLPPRGWLVDQPQEPRVNRISALEQMLGTVPDDAAIVATTGKTGRELFTLADRPQHFYLVGAMGCASAVGLGAALHTPRPVVVVDGDGAALMKLGNLATIGTRAPSNLIHLLIDNAAHDSTGGQRTASAGIRFGDIAIACGYRTAVCCSTPDELDRELTRALRGGGPHLLRVPALPGSIKGLGRPTLHPSEVARRFREFVTGPLLRPRALVEAAPVGAGALTGAGEAL
jgi:phosphonopyruvate decarboxylase